MSGSQAVDQRWIIAPTAIPYGCWCHNTIPVWLAATIHYGDPVVSEPFPVSSRLCGFNETALISANTIPVMNLTLPVLTTPPTAAVSYRL